MPPHCRSPAALLLLTWAVVGGGCQGASTDDGILFACESDGSCSEPEHVCAPDGLCRPRATLRSTTQRNIRGMSSQASASASAPVTAGQAPRAHQALKLASRAESPDERCAKRCASRQTGCTARCEGGLDCLQHCVRAADSCYAKCHDTREAREAARQQRDRLSCMGADGRARACSEDEKRQLLAALGRAATLLCHDENGEQVLCPENVEQIEKSRRFIPDERGVGSGDDEAD